MAGETRDLYPSTPPITSCGHVSSVRSGGLLAQEKLWLFMSVMPKLIC